MTKIKEDYATKILKTPEGVKISYFDNKLHSWDVPAIRYPKAMKKKDEYYLYGIRYEAEEWKEMKKQWEGLPWYKTPAILMDAGSARN